MKSVLISIRPKWCENQPGKISFTPATTATTATTKIDKGDK